MKEKTSGLCPECDGEINFPNPQIGQRVVCSHCNADLEVIGLNPIELDWFFEDDEFYDFDEEDDW
jgi:alpha-aminoadipate carrier protein LysW